MTEGNKMPIIRETKGDLLESNIQTLVVPVNTVGVMGKGLALHFKIHFPGLLEQYQKACQDNVFKDKGIFVYTLNKGRQVLCFPSKRHWKYSSRLIWIEEALKVIVRDYKELGITELAIPAVGCGLGGLLWEDVRNLIYQYLDPLEIDITVFVP